MRDFCDGGLFVVDPYNPIVVAHNAE